MIASAKSRKRIFGSACLVFGATLLGAFLHREFTNRREGLVTSTNASMVDDMSHMNATKVQQVWDVPGDEPAAETALRNLLERARTNHLRVAIAGAGHSMGGQTIAPNGIRINMLPLKAMALNEQTDILHVERALCGQMSFPILINTAVLSQ